MPVPAVATVEKSYCANVPPVDVPGDAEEVVAGRIIEFAYLPALQSLQSLGFAEPVLTLYCPNGQNSHAVKSKPSVVEYVPLGQSLQP